ncbi:MAG: CHAT domain-containing protein [Leptolyngbyaceae cyanobacterium]
MTQEFHLSITALGSDRYLIRTEDTAAGVPVAEAQVEWPVDDWLQQAQPAMDDPLVGQLQGTVDLSDCSSGLHQLGQELYQALFQDDAIRESWQRAQGIAQHRNEILRLRLGLKDSRLQRLPWEVLRHDQQPITTRSNQTFARYGNHLLVEQTAETGHRPEPSELIQVLMVIASPEDQARLQLLKELRLIQALLAATDGQPAPIHIDVLEQPDRSQLAQKLEQGNYQVLHYAGHSDFGQNGGELSLVNRQTGLTERLSGDDLAGLLVNNQVTLTVFNSCRSGHTAGDDAAMDWRQQNLVQALVNRGIPSVIAMAERIPDEVAIAFTRLFYQNLRQGLPIDVSLSRTRQGLISGFGSDQSYWALPILYLHPEFDGYLTGRDRAAADQLNPDMLSITEPSLPLPPAAASPSEPPVSIPAPVVTESLTELPSASAESPLSETPLPPDQPLVEGAPTTFLNQLDGADLPEPDDDDLLASYVQQLSQTSVSNEEPLLPADAAEVLTEAPRQEPGLAIYNRLPEVPPPAEPSPTTSAASIAERPQVQPPQMSSPAAKAATRSPRPFNNPLLVWLTLASFGVLSIVGLGWFAFRWVGDGSRSVVSRDDVTVTPTAPQPASPAAATLIRQAEDAIKSNRYADAREDFGAALNQSLQGKADPNEVSDTIWPWVDDATQPDLLFVKGRIAWQEAKLIESDQPDFDSRFNQRTFIEQARNAWEQTDDRFIEGRIARGFAAYAEGDWADAIANWEAALNLYDDQRQRQPNPAGNVPAAPVILHAYAGLVMTHTRLGNINLAGIEEDPGLSTASEEEQAVLLAESEIDLAIAQEYFQRLQSLDELNRMDPQVLGIVGDEPPEQYNWLWTLDQLEDWRRNYRYWSEETRSTVISEPE